MTNNAYLNIGNSRIAMAYREDHEWKVMYEIINMEKYLMSANVNKIYAISVNSENEKQVNDKLGNFAEILYMRKSLNMINSKYSIDDIGIDRMMSIYFIQQRGLYPSVIMDLGTADTFDYIDSDGYHFGGLITPGLHTLHKAICEHTEKIPYYEPQFSGIITGTSTKEAVTQGIYGQWLITVINYAGLMSEFEKSFSIIATGGNALRLKDFIANIEINSDLIFSGMELYAENIYNAK